jgi:hypothetical protein
VCHIDELYDYLVPGQLIGNRDVSRGMRDEWRTRRPGCWMLQAGHGLYGDRSVRQEERATRPSLLVD